MQKRVWLCVLAIAVASVPPAAWGQTDQATPAPAPPPPQPPACTSPEHKQFDFWVGEWNITDSKGPAGVNRIEKILDGCVVQEHWQGNGGLEATSLTLYDSTDKKWHQVLVDNQGSLVMFEGGLKDGKIEMTGTRINRRGQQVQLKVTWEPQADGRVRQVLVSSPDSGKTWNTVFDDVYERKR
jgi:hypothetical protein